MTNSPTKQVNPKGSESYGRWLGPLTPVLAALAALLIGALMLLALGANPVEAYTAMASGAFGSVNALADRIVKATPLLFVGAGICISFRGGVLNIGGEGQLIVGALAATLGALTLGDWPGWGLIPIRLPAGRPARALGGA